jgi:hypothetical protein
MLLMTFAALIHPRRAVARRRFPDTLSPSERVNQDTFRSANHLRMRFAVLYGTP